VTYTVLVARHCSSVDPPRYESDDVWPAYLREPYSRGVYWRYLLGSGYLYLEVPGN